MTIHAQRFHFRSFVAVCVLLLSPWVHADLESDLTDWGNLFRQASGVDLTPPMGSVRPEVVNAQKVLAELVQTLAGPDIAAQGLVLQVSIFSSDIPNAFMAARTVPKSLRKHFGLRAHQDTIYQLGVTAGLLKSIQSLDELAFVLSHELTHLLEGHVQPGDSPSQRWWSSQQHEAVADMKAFERVAGKFEMEAGIRFLNRLAEMTPVDDGHSLLSEALSDHHSVGVRLAMDEAVVEALHATRPGTHGVAPRPVPSELRLHLQGRDRNRHSADFEAFLPILSKFTAKIFVTDKDMDPASPPKAYGKNRFLDYLDQNPPPSTRQMVEAIFEVMANLDGLAVSKQAKLNGMLKFLIYSQLAAGFSVDLNQALTQDQVLQLTNWFARNTSEWSPKSVLTWMEKSNSELWRESAPDTLFSSSSLREVFGRLAQSYPQWKEFHIGVETQRYMKAEGFDYSLYGLALKRILLEPKVDTERLDLAMSLMASPEFRRGLENAPSLAGMKFFEIYFQLREVPATAETQPALEQIRAALKPFEDTYIHARDVQIRSGSLSVLKDGLPGASTRDLETVLRSHEVIPLSPETLGILHRSLLNMVESSEGIPYQCPEYLALNLLELANQAKPRSKEGLRILKFLSAGLSSRGMHIAPRSGSNFRGALSRTFKDWTAQDVIAFLKSDWDRFDARLKSLEIALPKKGTRITQLPRAKAVSLLVWEQLRRMKLDARLGLLNLLGFDPELSLKLTSGFSESEAATVFQLILKLESQFLASGKAHEAFLEDGANIHLGPQSSLFLMDLLVKMPASARWLEHYSSLYRLFPGAPFVRAEHATAISDHLRDALADLKPRARLEAMKTKEVRQGLRSDAFIEFTKQLMDLELEKRPKGRAALMNAAASTIERLNQDLSLELEMPWVLNALRQHVSKAYSLQPHEVDGIVTETGYSATERTRAFQDGVRGLSGLSALAKDLPPDQQLEFMEYVMGRTDRMPAIPESQRHVGTAGVPVAELVRNLRQRMSQESIEFRAFLIHSVLAGPDGLSASPVGRQRLSEHLLKSIRNENRDVARALLDALLDSQHTSPALVFSYLIAQRGESSAEPLTEAHLIMAVLEGYGVPGRKFGQYLVFSKFFGESNAALESIQDAARPVSWLEMIQLIGKRFGEKWPIENTILAIKGSGTMNIAVEYLEGATGARRVVTVLRDGIETQLQNDFFRFRKFLDRLSELPNAKSKFRILLGLANLVERSTRMEIDKEHGYRMQNLAHEIYSGTRGNWSIRTVKAYGVEGGLHQDLATGITARKLLQKDPAQYKSAMEALSDFEVDVLMGIQGRRGATEGSLLANPDFHDGQVLVDIEKRVVTLIDYGQAVEITTAERKAALEVLRVISGMESEASSVKLLERLTGGQVKPELAEVAAILRRTDRIERFMELISYLSVHGYEVPLPIVNWIFGVDRQIVLRSKIGRPIESKIGFILGANKMGASIGAINSTTKGMRAIGKFLSGIFGKSRAESEPQGDEVVPKGNPLVCEDVFR